MRAERDPLHQGIIVERATLKQRDFSLNLTGRLGKSQVVTNSTPLNQQVRRAPSYVLPETLCCLLEPLQVFCCWSSKRAGGRTSHLKNLLGMHTGRVLLQRV